MSTLRRVAAGAFAASFTSAAGVAAAEDPVKITGNGIEYRSDDNNVRLTLGGRLHLDAASIDDDGTNIEDSEVRRARIELSMRLWDKFRIRVDREFAGVDGWRNLWLRYDLTDRLNVKAGNFIAPFSMEDAGSSNDLVFMERSLAEALAPGFGVGVAGSYEGRRFSVSGGYFGDAIDAEDNIQPEKGKGFVARATWSPIERRSTVLHLGLGLERREFSTGDFRRISSRAEANLAPTILSTGAIGTLDTSTSYNVEAGLSAGPVLLQGQHISTKLAQTSGPDLTFDGSYAQIAWTLTGERRSYSDGAGVFASPVPRSKWGAVEIAARVSSLDLTDIGATGAKATDVTGGVNWYIGRNVRLMANYVHSEVDNIDPLLNRTVDVAEGRLQFDF